MGLFWSMELDPSVENRTPFARSGIGPSTVTIQAEAAGRQIDEATIERIFIAPDIQVTHLRKDGLVGEYFRPEEPGPFPGVLVVSGSGGGLRGAEEVAALLAAHGFAALALAYFNYEDLPPYLINIPLEYFERGLDWLVSQEQVDGERLAVVGRSRGGELALLLGSTFPQLKAVVGFVPSGIVHGGIGEGAEGQSAWTYRAEPVPFLRDQVTPQQDAEIFGTEPTVLTPRFELNLEDGRAVKAAEIAVERINGPVLLLSGKDDRLWPSTRLADIAYERLAEHNHQHTYVHLRYEGAGHSITIPNWPTTVTTSFHPIRQQVFDLGGDPQAQANANADSWPKVVTFLRESL